MSCIGYFIDTSWGNIPYNGAAKLGYRGDRILGHPIKPLPKLLCLLVPRHMSLVPNEREYEKGVI